MRGARVLVIEDDAAIAGLLDRGLRLHGLRVTIAEDGTAGREAWSAGGFDLILLDVMLPLMDGIQLLEERRAAGDRTPAIVLTARDDEAVRTRALAAGAEGYLTKPFAYAELVESIARLLQPGEASAQR